MNEKGVNYASRQANFVLSRKTRQRVPHKWISRSRATDGKVTGAEIASMAEFNPYGSASNGQKVSHLQVLIRSEMTKNINLISGDRPQNFSVLGLTSNVPLGRPRR